MRAVLMTAVGGPEVLQLAELPEPQITADHDVRVRLRAASINPVDYKLRSGGTIGGSLPAIVGWDGAGVVESTGSAVTRVRPGDEVYFCDGGFGRHQAPTRRPRSSMSDTWHASRGSCRSLRPQRRRWSRSPRGRHWSSAVSALEQAADAHHALEAGQVLGKAVLTMP